MPIPTLPTRCIILKSWSPDAIPDIISVQEINTATRAWSLTAQDDHEHWQDSVLGPLFAYIAFFLGTVAGRGEQDN